MRSKFVVRARILSGLLILLALLLVTRLYFLQIVQGDKYRENAAAQYVVEHDSNVIDRGAIFFTHRDQTPVAAAVMQTGWKIAIVPDDLEGAEATYDALASVTAVDRERFFASAVKNGDPYEEVAFRLSEEEASQVRAKKLPGVSLVRDKWRYYPGDELAAQVLGFVGFRADKRIGVYGLERQWEDTLTRTSTGLYVNPFAEIFTNLGAVFAADPKETQGDIVMTIEPSVETRLEETLEEIMRTYSARMAGGIVMDPKTGAIRAMATRPAFNPNTYNTVEDPGLYTNLLVEGIYEMGSIMKPLTVAAGIDSGAITPQSMYTDRGCIEKSGKTICNYDKKARGRVDMQEVLSRSLNVGIAHIVDTMGGKTFAQYVHAYDLGNVTNIGLPNEVAGNIRSVDSGYDVDYASAGFGQGIAVSPIGITRALAALANGGVLPNPHIVTEVKLENGISRSVVPGEGVRVLKPETAQTVTDMLVKVYDTALLEGVLKQEHYSIAAKTGTAQIAVPGGSGYYPDRYLHSFFGYFPAHDPKFIVFLFVIEPKGVEYASASLARPFLDIAKHLINYYNIPPDR
ncbi:penicillin-binding protein 2 [Candidatus Parcubacteria bacterium]|nr:MAG: penicillin-binding protein 2 [Candidatus Parcubacteria bacterium]